MSASLPPRGLRRAAALLALLAGAAALYLALGPQSGGGSLAALGLHAAAFLGAAGVAAALSRGWLRLLVVGLGAAAALCGGAALVPRLPGTAATALVYAHAVLAAAVLGLVAWVSLPERARAGSRQGFTLAAVAALVLLPAAGYFAAEYRQARWSPPEYDERACYRFLTATSPEQSGAPLFPSALRVSGDLKADCTRSGCHADVHAEWLTHGHARSGASDLYKKSFVDFTRRRGIEAGRWCEGCHAPERAAQAGTGAASVSCLACHGAEEVHGLYGSAALTLRGAGPVEPAEPRLRPRAHRDLYLRPSLHRSAAFCAACHRKNYNLPQNEFRWMPGPDEYRGWAASAYSGEALYAPPVDVGAKTCVGCHDPHSGDSRRPPSTVRRPSFILHPSAFILPDRPPSAYLDLDLFLRSPAPGPMRAETAEGTPVARPGEPLYLDVLVRNSGIGHDFPTGMPDLWDHWLEVEVREIGGRTVARSGQPTATGAPAEAHTYRLVALDRNGQTVPPGRADEMAAVREWRRIPAGGTDLARYATRVPAEGLGPVTVRLWRARRGASTEKPVLLAERRFRGGETAAGSLARRWRRYGEALAAVKAYPQAIHSLLRARELVPDDAETRLALARVYLEEGELLPAREELESLLASASGLFRDRVAAWYGAVLRRMGQPDGAAAQLQPLARRFPRDLRLRFELGRARMDQLRNNDAAREFQAMLDVDPLDVSAHLNLMLCYQRLNQLSRARIEETVYRLLEDEPAGAAPPAARSPEARPLHVHRMEP